MNQTEQNISRETREILLGLQRSEITEGAIYRKLAGRVKKAADRETLLRIAREEEAHAEIWRRYTGKELAPRRLTVLFYDLISRIFGYTFAIKIMEQGEGNAQDTYKGLEKEVEEAGRVSQDEEDHEAALISLLDEDRLQYVGSMVLGLNDALVELTGTLAGLSLALQNTRLVALSGLITGISATFSMASSEYLSARSEGHPDALKSSLYTGVMYLVAVALLVLPYLLFPAELYLQALGVMLLVVVGVIFLFTYYISVAKDLPFGKRFREMAGISLSVALLSFGVGLAVKYLLGIDI